MSIISRKTFVKSIGLCTALTAMGNIHEGFYFIPSHLDIENQLTKSGVCAYSENTVKNLYLGVGDPGLKVGQALLDRTQKINITCGNAFPIQQFNPGNNQINGLIADANFVFLVGSIKDRDFWTARELILSHNIFLLYTVIIDDGNPRLSAKGFKVNKNEGCVFIPEKNYENPAALAVHSLFSMLMMPGMVCVDGSDIKNVIGGQGGYMVHTACSYKDSHDVFKKTICICKPHIQTANCILFHIMYDEIIDYTLDDMTVLVDTVDECCSYDTEILWTSTEPLNLGADFRASLFIPFSS